MPIRFVCVSDTHCQHDKIPLPDGDVLLCTGDFCLRGEAFEISRFDAWLGRVRFRYKIVIAGNHDRLFEEEPDHARSMIQNAVYLQDSGTVIEGIKIWGSPWQPWFMDWAFNLRAEVLLQEKWDLIPPDIDILLTHGPPYSILDGNYAMNPCGSHSLLETVRRLKPRFHVFGHIHEGYGQHSSDDTVFINASICDHRYRPVNPPIVFDWPKV